MYAEKTEYDDVEMSSRLRNILRRNGFESLEGLREYPKEHFIKFRNMGQATLQELYQICEEQGIKLRSVEDLNDREHGVRFDDFLCMDAFIMGIKSKDDLRRYSLEELEKMCPKDKRLFVRLKKLKTVYGILASSNVVSTDITYYYEKLMQRSYNQMDNNEVVTEEVAAVVENNTGIEIEPLFEEQVDFDTFSKSDFRVVKVKNCEAVPKSKKLLRFTLDDGTENERTILSGVHAFYEPGELVGKTLLAIVNLPPRSMMGIDSCGMLLSAIHNVNGEEKLNLVMLDDSIPAGAKLY